MPRGRSDKLGTIFGGLAPRNLGGPKNRPKFCAISDKANISQTVHPIHSMFDSKLERYLRFDKIQDGGWRPSWIYKNGHNFATVLPIDVMLASRVRLSGSANLMVPLSMTLSDPKPQFQGHSIVYPVLGKGFRGRRIEWWYFRFNNIQDGGWWPSWNDGAVARNPCISRAFLFKCGIVFSSVCLWLSVCLSAR